MGDSQYLSVKLGVLLRMVDEGNARPHKAQLKTFLLTIFIGTCSGTLCICLISHPPITICL